MSELEMDAPADAFEHHAAISELRGAPVEDGFVSTADVLKHEPPPASEPDLEPEPPAVAGKEERRAHAAAIGLDVDEIQDAFFERDDAPEIYQGMLDSGLVKPTDDPAEYARNAAAIANVLSGLEAHEMRTAEALEEAYELYDTGIEQPHVIANWLLENVGPEAAGQFAAHWHAEEHEPSAQEYVDLLLQRGLAEQQEAERLAEAQQLDAYAAHLAETNAAAAAALGTLPAPSLERLSPVMGVLLDGAPQLFMPTSPDDVAQRMQMLTNAANEVSRAQEVQRISDSFDRTMARSVTELRGEEPSRYEPIDEQWAFDQRVASRMDPQAMFRPSKSQLIAQTFDQQVDARNAIAAEFAKPTAAVRARNEERARRYKDGSRRAA